MTCLPAPLLFRPFTSVPLSPVRYEKRQALKARFEIEQKLRRERQVEKRRAREREREERQRRMMREKRSKQQDKSKSRAISELKANRSAGKLFSMWSVTTYLHVQVELLHSHTSRLVSATSPQPTPSLSKVSFCCM